TLKDVLTAPHMPLWFPDLTDTLVDMGWQTLHRHTGITKLDYGTARALASDARAPRHVMACLSFHPGADGVTLHVLAECLVDDVARHYQEVGLTFYAPDEIANTLACLQEAIAILASIPTLHRTIAQLVRVCHLIKPEDDDYDVSYSDPQVPFS